jgi:hypothetical protein
MCSVLGICSGWDPGLAHQLVCRVVTARNDCFSLFFELAVEMVGGFDIGSRGRRLVDTLVSSIGRCSVAPLLRTREPIAL